MPSKVVKCSYPRCSDGQGHHESMEVGRPHRKVEVPADHPGPWYCSFECQAYHKAEQGLSAEWPQCSEQGCILSAGHIGAHRTGSIYHPTSTWVTKCPDECLYQENKHSGTCEVDGCNYHTGETHIFMECVRCGHNKEIAMDAEQLISDLADLFGDVDDMSQLDASEFKDNAGKIWALRERAVALRMATEGDAEDKQSTSEILSEAFRRFHALCNKYAHLGACDTEPREFFFFLMEKACEGEAWEDPEPRAWQLYSSSKGWEAAADVLSAEARVVAGLLQQSPHIDVTAYVAEYGYWSMP